MDFEKYLPIGPAKWIENNLENASDISLLKDKFMFVSGSGYIKKSDYMITGAMLEYVINKMCNGSIYSNQHTLRKGYITLKEGYRVGFSGEIFVSEKDGKEYLRNITGINIRIARNIKGAASKIIPHISDFKNIYNTLIIAPPSAGKTTILKDISEQLGMHYRVGIVDERNEMFPCEGNYVFSVRGTSKYSGILMLLRSMAPEIVVTDEIGEEDDEYAIGKLINAGVKIICTAHGYDENDILRRKILRELISSESFERIVVISNRNGPGTLEKVIDTKRMKVIA